ncbi:hypothetical protein [Pseudoglutamicibacter cumminsii]|uniref:Uncharacterized protein n=1 Tax=Pseudoglutamicibacter cumminsii TaxID=156979 RepID=A0AAP4FDQ7_9MICC|nr:hypothetical protein [Pseudoglutamicibacter cumminsii]MCT1686334.1 hypothetical protein [Pseudoglutamicibacter cumminsii]MDK6275486.1 hypothetical protein [Pseudoglutamicibacter cumminsii]
MSSVHKKADTQEEGRIAVMIAGLMGLLIAVIAVTSALNHVAISQRKLTSIADSVTSTAVLSKSQAKAVQENGHPDVNAARADIERQLKKTPLPAQLQNLRIDSVEFRGEPLTLHVNMSATTQIPIIGGILPGSAHVHTHAFSRLEVQ